jgi:hypothetical protein
VVRNTPEQEATVRDWLGLPQDCLRCGRPSRWCVRPITTQKRHFACYYHLEYVINHVLTPAGGLTDVVVSRLA